MTVALCSQSYPDVCVFAQHLGMHMLVAMYRRVLRPQRPKGGEARACTRDSWAAQKPMDDYVALQNNASGAPWTSQGPLRGCEWT